MSPEKLPHPCAHPGCRETVQFGTRCQKHRRERFRMELSRRVPNPFYKTALWQRARISYLRMHPSCQAPGCNALARVVDHLVPLAAGGPPLDPENFAAMCDTCHNRKRSLEANYPDFFIRLLDTFRDYESKDVLILAIFEQTSRNQNARR